MNPLFNFTMNGYKEVTSNIGKLDKAEKKIMAQVAKDNGKMMADAIKVNMRRKRTGALALSIGFKVKAKRGRITSIAGARRGFKVNVKTIAKVMTASGETHAIAYGDASSSKGKGRTKAKEVVLKAAKHVNEGDTLGPSRYLHLADKPHQRGVGGPGHTGISTGHTQGQGFMELAWAQTAPKAKRNVAAALAAIRAD